MPLHLSSSSRRAFLTQLGAAAVFGPVVRSSAASHPVDPDLIAILNDTHIGEKHPEDSPIPSNLQATVAYLTGLPKHPAAVVINGDLALKDGQAGDYAHFAKLIAPLREADIPVHLTMGNHDDRHVFYEVLKTEKSADEPVVSKHVGVVTLGNANLFLLDSLKETMVTQGLLGEEQLRWLGHVLDAHTGKPALVFAHHNPRLGGEEIHFPGGLEDSQALWDLLAVRPQVKAYVHGHIHHRNYFAHRGIHLLNTPATSYVAKKDVSTTGWTMARLADLGGEFTTLTHEADHRWNGVTEKLAWRTA